MQDRGAEKVLGQATGRSFTSLGKSAMAPAAFHAFRGSPEPLDSPRNAQSVGGSRKCPDAIGPPD